MKTHYGHNDPDAPDPVGQPEAYADYLFDSVSAVLRDRPEAGKWSRPSSRATKADLVVAVSDGRRDFQALRRDLVGADTAFDALHEWIASGGPLPGPWRKATAHTQSGAGGQ
jgi:hypothetical protein